MRERGRVKILYVITKLELGGAQKVCLDLARGFSGEHEVWLMTGPGGMLNSQAAGLLRGGDRRRLLRPVP